MGISWVYCLISIGKDWVFVEFTVNLQISKQPAAMISYITKQSRISGIFVKEEEEGGWELSLEFWIQSLPHSLRKWVSWFWSFVVVS